MMYGRKKSGIVIIIIYTNFYGDKLICSWKTKTWSSYMYICILEFRYVASKGELYTEVRKVYTAEKQNVKVLKI